MAKKISTIVEKYKRWQVDKVKPPAIKFWALGQNLLLSHAGDIVALAVTDDDYTIILNHLIYADLIFRRTEGNRSLHRAGVGIRLIIDN